MDKQEMEQQLREIAFKRSTAFCYQCYIKCSDGYCSQCRSDDLMRCLDGVGVEYGTSWIVEHILSEELAPANVEEAFEESVRQCYPEQTTVGWMTFDTVRLMKEQDPVSWRCALSEYESQEESDESIVSFDGGSIYYARHDLEVFIEDAASGLG